MRFSLKAFMIAASLLTACGGPAETPANTPVSKPSETMTPTQAASPTTPTADAKVIVMLGDSLTAGYGLRPDEALPAVIQKRMSADGYDVKLINAGVSGDTTANGLARFDWSVASARPDILVIALGANDFLQGLPVDIARSNLAAIIERAKAADMEVILASLEPHWPETDGSLEAAYAQIYPDLASEYDVPLYSGFMRGVWDTPTLLMGDGLHPTAQGVETMADRLTVFLEDRVEGTL